MDTIVVILQGLLLVMSLWLSLLLLWQLFISLYGYRRNTKTYADHEPDQRFLILVPAHNEEVVIGDIIENLSQMDYPKELYDFYILADNCTDHTVEIARKMGANVLELHRDSPESPTGKPIALQKALRILDDYHEKYDLIMIFDSDNLMDKNMLREVNSQYLDSGKSAEVIQCYLGMKNRQGLVALFYYMSFTISNRFLQFARTCAGLNCGIGGTGFAVTTRYVHERGGWTAMSLTEDFEMQVEATCEGRRVLWNHNVRVYDEKPTKFRASYRQCKRWAQGHWFVAFRNTKSLFSALMHHRISLMEFISTFLQMYTLTPSLLLVLQFIIQGTLKLMGQKTWFFELPNASGASGFSIDIPALLLFVYSFVFLFYTAENRDNHIPFDLKTLPKLLVSLVVNMLIASLSHIVGLFLHRRQSVWVKTDHSLHSSESMKP